MASIEIDAGRRTEDLLQFITAEIDDATLDAIGVERRTLKSDQLATEPVTIAVTLTLSATLIVTVGRLIERWMEQQRQREQLKIVAEGFAQSDAAGKALAKLSEKHASVAVAYRLPAVPAGKAGGGHPPA